MCKDIISKRLEKSKTYYKLAFIVENSDGTEWMDFDLPHPNYHFKTVQGHLLIMWHILGYFGTKKSVDYLNDIIARFIFAFQENKVQRTEIWSKREDALTHDKINELKDFQNLQSLNNKTFCIDKRAESIQNRDQIFWSIKLNAEYLIKNYKTFTYDDLLNFALTNFEDYENSTLRAKCRNIFEWYDERDFKISEKREQKYSNLKEYHRETKMTRTEHIIKVNKQRAETKERAILNLTSGLFSDDYKKKNGTWNKQLIADTLNINKRTVYKYLD